MTEFLRPSEIAFGLLISGLLIGYVEFHRPGTVLPGVAGLVLILLGIARLASLHWSALGLLLSLTAIVCLAADVRFALRGLGAAFAVLCLACGLRLFIPQPHEMRVRWLVALLLALAWVPVTYVLLRLAWLARANKMTV